MDNVSFQEEEQIVPLGNKGKKQKVKKESSFVALVIKTKIAKDEKEAKPILITIAICFFIVSGIITYWEFFPPPSISYQKAIQADTLRIEAIQARPAQATK